MKHNDRLDELLVASLRPYDLVASPSPQLTLFLNIDILVAWYLTVLKQEMIDRVDAVVQVCVCMCVMFDGCGG